MSEITAARLYRNNQLVASDKHRSTSGMCILDQDEKTDYVYFNLKEKALYKLAFDGELKGTFSLEFDVKELPLKNYKDEIPAPKSQFWRGPAQGIRIENLNNGLIHRSSGLIRLMD